MFMRQLTEETTLLSLKDMFRKFFPHLQFKSTQSSKLNL